MGEGEKYWENAGENQIEDNAFWALNFLETIATGLLWQNNN